MLSLKLNKLKIGERFIGSVDNYSILEEFMVLDISPTKEYVKLTQKGCGGERWVCADNDDLTIWEMLP
jgi:hypothetical protein